MNVVNGGQVRKWVGGGGPRECDIVVETEPIKIYIKDKALLDTLVESKKDTYAEIVRRLIEEHNKNLQTMKEVQIDEWGKAMISRTLKGKTIQYRVK